MKYFLKFLLFFFLCLNCGFATDIKIKSVTGNVIYYRDRVMSVLTPKTQLRLDDLILTQDGRLVLEFEETTLVFTPHSLFKVMNVKNSQRHQFGEFLMGEFYASTRDKLVDKRVLEVLLPRAKVHIVGTRYIVQIAPSVEILMQRQEGKFQKLPRLELIPEAVSSNDLVTQVTCFEGKVFVTTDSGQNQELEVNDSVLYSGVGANIRISKKDEAELATLFESLGFKQSDVLSNSEDRAK